MSIQLKETQGDSLQGVIDGVNYAYVCSFDFVPETVNVFVNGRLKIRDWDDGFVVILPRTIHMKEPLLPGDSLEVEYRSPTQTGGGALGGCPGAPRLSTLEPQVAGESLTPEATTAQLQASTSVAGAAQPSLLAEKLTPVIIGSSAAESTPCSGLESGGTVITEGLGGE